MATCCLFQTSALNELTCVEEGIICQRHSIHCVETDTFGWINIFKDTDPQHQIFKCVLCRIHICKFKMTQSIKWYASVTEITLFSCQ